MKLQSIRYKFAKEVLQVILVIGAVLTVYNTFRDYAEFTNDWMSQESTYLTLGLYQMHSGEVETPGGLKARLDDAVGIAALHFFFLRKDGEPIGEANLAGPNDNLEFEGLRAKAMSHRGHYQDSHINFFYKAVGPYELILGHKISREGYFEISLKRASKKFLFNVVVILLGVLVVFIRAFGIISQLILMLQSGSERTFDPNKAKTKDDATLVLAFSGYQDQIVNLTDEVQRLQRQVAPSIQYELGSGKQRPYYFTGAAARTDVNDYSTIKEKVGLEVISTYMDLFFSRAAKVIKRHGGFVHGYYGDEVLYYFKEDVTQNASWMALAAIRELNRVAEEMDRLTMHERRFHFKIKSSISFGQIRFGQQIDESENIASDTFTDTKRMIDAIQGEQKSRNPVIFDSKVRNHVIDGHSNVAFGTLFLKGMGDTDLFLHGRERALAEYLADWSTESFEKLQFFRSDQDIQEILSYLISHRRELPRERAVQLIRQFERYTILSEDDACRRLFCRTLDVLISDVIITNNSKTVELLSALITVTPSFYTRANFDEKIKSRLVSCYQLLKERVTANADIVLCELDPEAVRELPPTEIELLGSRFFLLLTKFFPMASPPRNRANRLIILSEAIFSNARFEKEVAPYLNKMLTDRDFREVASGLFALGEISLNRRMRDEVNWRVNASIHEMLKQIPELFMHENESVRRQARDAAWKSGMIQELHTALVSETMRAEYKTEIEHLLALKGEINPIKARQLGMRIKRIA